MNVSSPGVRRQRGMTRPAMPVEARRSPAIPAILEVGPQRSNVMPKRPRSVNPSRPEGEVGLHRSNVMR